MLAAAGERRGGRRCTNEGFPESSVDINTAYFNMSQLEAFRKFDFDGHEGWRAYRLNLEVPPGKEAILERFQAKWYKNNIDPDFDVSLVKPAVPPPTAAPEPGSAPRRPPPSSYVPPPKPQPQPQPQAAASGAGYGTGSRAQSAGVPPPPPSATTGVRAGRVGELTLLAANVVLILSAVATLQPLDRRLSWQAYFLCCRASLVANGYKVYLRFGLPSLRPFPAAVTPWLQQVAASTELFHVMLSSLMMQTPQLWMGVVPLAVLAVYPVLSTLGSRFGTHPLWQRYGARAQAALDTNKPLVMRFTSTAEIAMGFQLLLGILQAGLRGAMLAYVYWNQLRVRYWSPESRPYHVAAWANINAKAQPVLNAVPAVRRYLDTVVNWFQQPGQQQPHRQ